jgi:hypothetical protein
MNTEKYKGLPVTVKSTGQEGFIKDVVPKVNMDKVMSVRFVVDDPSGRPVEYMPHEVEIQSQVV